MFYDRQIKYFEYRKNNERICNGGFVKIEVRNGMCNLMFNLSGVNVTDTLLRQIYIIAEGREEQIGTIELQAGRGVKQLCMQVGDLSGDLSGNPGSKIEYEALRGIRIPIAAGTELYCKVADEVNEREKLYDVEDEECAEDEECVEDEERVEDEECVEGNTSEGTKACESEEAVSMSVRPYKADDVVVVREEVLMGADAYTVEAVTEEAKPKMEKAKMQEDKWQQLSAIYPHIIPFQDDREYLKLGPEDFVIFNSRFYKLVHNSFLLHGYYNYQHLILARMEQKGLPCYYIGVPGNFYDREKQVAVMFGFESFECRIEPANTGDYGYYMIRTEL